MKPEILQIKNIGPFAGTHTIDFSNLDSIFLVCGKTGAGKTTLFDAIAYAFFSKPFGSRSAITRNLRSQFAKDSEDAEVVLSFTIGTDKYKILRRLPFYKPGKKNETPEEVRLSKWKNNCWEDLTSTKKETNEKIRNIIKLTEKEFSRIVLLPQGDFAVFLKENSNQKQETLSELFPVSKYSDIMQRAKELQKEKNTKIKFIQNALDSLYLKFDITDYQIQKIDLETRIELIKKDYTQTAKLINEKTLELEQAKLLKQQYAEYENVCTELNALKLRIPEMDALKIKIERAHRAAVLSGQAESIRKLKTSINENSSAVDLKVKDLNIITNMLNRLKKDESKIIEEKNKTEALKTNLTILEQAISVYKIIEEKKEELKFTGKEKKDLMLKLNGFEKRENEITATISELENVIHKFDTYKEAFDEASAHLTYLKMLSPISETKQTAAERFKRFTEAAENSRKNLEIILKDAEMEKVQLNRLKKEKEAEELNEKAAGIACNLIEGEPCPVCGSLHHPKPAVETGADIFTLKDKIEKSERVIELLLKKKENEDKNYTELKKDVQHFKDEIEDAENKFVKLNADFSNKEFTFSEIPNNEDVKKIIAAAAEKLSGAETKLKESRVANITNNNLQKELQKIQKDKENLNSTLMKISVDETKIQTSLYENQKLYDDAMKRVPDDIQKIHIEDTVEHCKDLILEGDRKVNGYNERMAENKLKYGRLESAIIELQERIKKDEIDLQNETETLKNALNKKGFASVEELLDSILKEYEIEEFETAIKNFNEEMIALKQKSKSLKEDLYNKEIKDVENLSEEITSLQKNIDEDQARVEDFTKQLTLLNSYFDESKKLSADLTKALEDSKLITQLSDSLNGENKLKLKFDIWMLSAFLREITVYANRRLERMSDGRYILKVSSEVSGNNLSGLDLEIYDAYTGGMRPTASLSGGETFMASISLALGLADSIQNRSGGIKLDSMFIDEGFGSLDEASLENAISILDEIRGNRMVGIISHVSELKMRIPQKIEIEKTSRGSRIIV